MQQLFAERVADADRLYGEGELPGSLTQRGRALILLGPPTALRFTQRRVPVALAGSGQMRPTRLLPQEEWVYQRRDLAASPAGCSGLPEGEEVTLVFLMESRRTVLVQGEDVLVAAARRLVRHP